MPGPAIPYIELGGIPLTLLKYLPFLGDSIDPNNPPLLQPFGVYVGAGIMAGVEISMARCRQRGLDPKAMTDFILFVVITGFVVAHMFDALFYQWPRVVDNPLYLLYLHKGWSSFGGFLGAGVGAIAWYYVRGRSPMEFVDVTASAFPVAWIFGRLGCAIVHDHPGKMSNAWYAVKWPADQLAAGFAGRLDLGLIEMVLTIPLALTVTWLWRRQPRRAVGFFLGAASVAYAPVRFMLDFLRAAAGDALLPAPPDPRYAGLTAAQWACFAAFGFGLHLLRGSLGKPYVRTAPAERVFEEQAADAPDDDEQPHATKKGSKKRRKRPTRS